MNATSKQIFYHVGLERTGTTFLQKSVFPHFDEIRYIPKRAFTNAVDIIRNENHTKFLVSKEPEVNDLFEPEVRAFAVHFPHAQPIVVFRPHAQWVESQFKRFIKNGYPMTIHQLIDLKDDRGMFLQEHLNYQRILQILARHFDKQPIVLSYPDLQAHPKSFVQTLAHIMNVSANFSSISFKQRHTSYNNKQLRALLRVMRYIDIKRHRPRKKGALHALHGYYKDIVRYLVIHTAPLLPDGLISSESLIDQRTKHEISEKYAADWQYVMSICTPVEP